MTIRPARAEDVPLIHALICELADYEKLRDEVDAREMDVAVALFGPAPRAFCDIAEWQGKPRVSRCGSTTIRHSAVAMASISKICSCAPNFAATASARR